MVKKIVIILLAFLIASITYAKDMTITVIYNNIPYDKDLTTAWGISCVIEGSEKTVLFDTGGDGFILLANMEKLGIDPGQIDIVVLSHIHGDHTGGFWDFLEKNNRVVVFLPGSFPESFKNKAKMIAKKVIPVHKPVKVCERVWSTGEMGTWIKEQSLIIDTDEGLVVVTGCAHPGIVNIARFAKDRFKKQVLLLAGGFHLAAYNENQVKKIIEQLNRLGIKKVGPSHCTGNRAMELFKKAWDENFFDFGCGARIKIKIE